MSVRGWLTLGWGGLIVAAFYTSIVLAYADILKGNYGGALYSLVVVASFLLFLLPLVGFWGLNVVYLRSEEVGTSRHGRGLFYIGVLIWIGLAVLLGLLRHFDGSLGQSVEYALWIFLSVFIFVAPSGARILAERSAWSADRSFWAALGATALSAVFVLAGMSMSSETLFSAGPLPAFGFSVLLLLLYLANLNVSTIWAWFLSHAMAIFVGGYFSNLIFFQGLFYGGGMGPHLLFLLVLVLFGVARTASSMKPKQT